MRQADVEAEAGNSRHHFSCDSCKKTYSNIQDLHVHQRLKHLGSIK